MPRLPLVSLTCAFALALAGCDRESAEPAQPAGEAAEAAEELSGKEDRSFTGEDMPAVQPSAPEGRPLDTASLRGKPVLANLWATRRVPCVTGLPRLDRPRAPPG